MKGFRKYIIALIVTVAIFAIAWFASEYFNNQKIEAIKDAQQQVTVDIMSSETQFDLLDELSCQDVDNNLLSQEISDLADQLTYAEQNLNDQSQVTLLKQQYSHLGSERLSFDAAYQYTMQAAGYDYLVFLQS